MSVKILTAAVVGLGNIGLGYDLKHQRNYVLTHTKAFQKHQGFNLLFGVDLHRGNQKAFTKFTGRPAFGSLREAAPDFDRVDVVSVCVPLNQRRQVLKDVFKFKPKVIILEKPMASTVREAQEFMRLCAKHKIALCINYPRRFDATTEKLHKIIQSKVYGKILAAEVFYNGGLYNNASHFIDLLSVALGKISVVKVLKRKNESADYALDAVLKCANVPVYLKNVAAACPVGEVNFWFERGRVQYQRFGLEVVYSSLHKDKVFRQYDELAPTKREDTQLPYALKHVIENVHEFLTQRKLLLSDGNTALETLMICERIHRTK